MCLKRIHLGEKAQTYVGCIDLHTRTRVNSTTQDSRRKIFISKSEKKKKKEIENYSSRMKAPTKKKK